MQENVTAALDAAQRLGFTEVETAGTGNLTVAKFSGELRSRGLAAASAHFSYDALKRDAAAAVRDATILGAAFLVCPSLPREPGGVKAEDARRAAAEFNAWGAACRATGLTFAYHPHGMEFTPTAAGGGEVAFDVLARESNWELVRFELDPFWAVHGGQDPVALLEKYSGRWALMHVKDMRRGAPTGFSTGRAPTEDNVAVGSGRIDWPAVLRAAKRAGVQHYFVEDETATPFECIPASLAFLRGLQLGL